MKEMLVIHVLIDSSLTVKGKKGEGQMIFFHGSVDGPYFNGEILPGGIDTQKQYAGEARTLSARYVLKGQDYQGNDCQIFIENNAVAEFKRELITHPIIFTDSPALQWMEEVECYGVLQGRPDGVTITVVQKEE